MTATPAPSGRVFAFPTSFAQELLWLLDRATPGMTAYNMPRARRLRGALDESALRRALDALVARHEILRTTYGERDGEPVQLVAAERAARLVVEDLSALPSGDRAAPLLDGLRREAQTPFDLTTDLLLRASLFRLAPDESVLLLTTHHIASDGWSGEVMFRELFALYEAARAGVDAGLSALPIQYADFAAWQRETLAGPRFDELLTFWREQMQGSIPVLTLPTDRARPPQPGFEGASVGLSLAPELVAALRALGQHQGASLYMVLLAAYQAVLHRWSGQDDIVVGSPMAGRDREETQGLIGYFANILALRSRFADDPGFATLVARVRDTCLGAFEHHEMPLERLALDLRQSGQLSDASLFRVVFTQVDDTPAPQSLPGVMVEPVGFGDGTVKFDLVLFLGDRPDGVRLSLYYRTDLFVKETAERFLGHLNTLLEAAVARPATPVSQLPLATPAERSRLAEWNATDQSLGPPATLVDLVRAVAQRRPGAVAVVSEDGALTYAELLARSHRVAHQLRRMGVGPDSTVGLCLERSSDLIVGMLGILAAGGAYVPLAPDQPAARIARQLEESRARIVVTATRHRGVLPGDLSRVELDGDAARLEAHPDSCPETGLGPEHLAYVLFTSGSTGVPKGVAVSHANLVHYIRAIAERLGIERAGGDLHFGSVSTLAADLGHTAVFPALASGGTLHLLSEAVVMHAARYREYVEAHPLDLLKITPSHLQALAGPELAAAHLPRKWLVLGGEACPWPLVQRVRETAPCRVLNHYGPTETTVGACTFEVGTRDVSPWTPATVPIGMPLSNVRTWVLDARGQEQPVGLYGELVIGGSGVARGYLHRDELTAERFCTREGSRAYRTGDLVRRLPTGDLEFLGRIDQQVKIRGHRVELGEIEAVLATHSSVRQAAVTLREDVLIAYLVLAGEVPDAALSAHVAGALPQYMIPDAWVRLERLPLTPNGKVDRAALPALPPRGGAAAGDQGPRNETEQTLADIWTDVLKRERVGTGENFFALGGHSLLAIRLLGRIAKTFGTRLSLRTLFEAPTIAELAVILEPWTPAEQRMGALWAEVLKKERVGRHDNFFVLGGHSLLAIRLLGRVAKATGVRLPLRTLFDHPTLAAFTEFADLEAQLAEIERLSEADAERLLSGERGPEGPAT